MCSCTIQISQLKIYLSLQNTYWKRKFCFSKKTQGIVSAAKINPFLNGNQSASSTLEFFHFWHCKKKRWLFSLAILFLIWYVYYHNMTAFDGLLFTFKKTDAFSKLSSSCIAQWAYLLSNSLYVNQLHTRLLVGSTDQACSSGFYFRIPWKSTKRPSFF